MLSCLHVSPASLTHQRLDVYEPRPGIHAGGCGPRLLPGIFSS
jgi:hypothetical protein